VVDASETRNGPTVSVWITSAVLANLFWAYWNGAMLGNVADVVFIARATLVVVVAELPLKRPVAQRSQSPAVKLT